MVVALSHDTVVKDDIDSAGVVIGIEVISIRHPWPLAESCRTIGCPRRGRPPQELLLPAPDTGSCPPPMPAPPSVEVHATQPVLVGAAAQVGFPYHQKAATAPAAVAPFCSLRHIHTML